jgi:acetyltransferase-like isoleucine patch superfamily enzyme
LVTIHGFLTECIDHAIMHGPSNRYFSDLRWKRLRRRLRTGSGKFSSLTGLSIPCPERVWIGEGVSLNQNVVVNACNGGEIRIGEHSLVGPFVLFRAADHTFSDPDRRIGLQGHQSGRIVIEEDCWIGGHVTITRDVTIGRGSVIGAQSVVTRDVPPYSVVAGNPARVIRSRREPLVVKDEGE